MNDNKPTPKPKAKQQPLAQKKVFDVTRPGKAPAAPNSRNVIVGHKKPVKDDMFVAGAESHGSRATNPSEKHALMNKKSTALKPMDNNLEASAPPVNAKAAAAAMAALGSQATGSTVEADTLSAPESTITPNSAPTAPVLSDASPVPAPETAQNAASQEASPTDTPSVNNSEATAPLLETHNDEHADVMPDAMTGETVQPTSINSSDHDDEEDIPDFTNSSRVIHHDIVAQTSAPMIELDRAVVSHHKHHTSWWTWLLLFLAIIALGLVALNFLLDADLVTTQLDIPHTNLIR